MPATSQLPHFVGSRKGRDRPFWQRPSRRGSRYTMKEWVSVLRAADAAARWHVHQRRKGSAEEPYINHLLEVASLVAEATEGKDPNLVIAALLHDAIEDCEVPHKVIAEAFGNDVADLVAEVTDDKTTEKAERKEK